MTGLQMVGVAFVLLGMLAVFLAQARALDAARARMLAVRMELAAVQRCIVRGHESAVSGDCRQVIRDLEAASKSMLGVALMLNGLPQSDAGSEVSP